MIRNRTSASTTVLAVLYALCGAVWLVAANSDASEHARSVTKISASVAAILVYGASIWLAAHQDALAWARRGLTVIAGSLVGGAVLSTMALSAVTRGRPFHDLSWAQGLPPFIGAVIALIVVASGVGFLICSVLRGRSQ
jgi:cytochrome bd-type quinol oxidase subunit 2